jgi:hypothetical protein
MVRMRVVGTSFGGLAVFLLGVQLRIECMDWADGFVHYSAFDEYMKLKKVGSSASRVV